MTITREIDEAKSVSKLLKAYRRVCVGKIKPGHIVYDNLVFPAFRERLRLIIYRKKHGRSGLMYKDVIGDWKFQVGDTFSSRDISWDKDWGVTMRKGGYFMQVKKIGVLITVYVYKLTRDKIIKIVEIRKTEERLKEYIRKQIRRNKK